MTLAPWHPYAIKLYARGLTLREIGRIIQVDHKAVHRVVNPDAKQQAREASRVYRRNLKARLKAGVQ